MSSFKHRLVTTLIGVPLLLTVIFLLPQFEHLAFAIVATVFTLLGSKEIYRIIKLKLKVTPNIPFYFCGLLPISAWVSSVTEFSNLVELTLIFLLIISFTVEIFAGAKQEKPYEDSIKLIVADSFSLLYPAYLISFIIKVNDFPQVSALYGLFFICVFSNDIFAYIFGMLFGKSTRGLIKASPNKSIVGFSGGILSCTAISVGTVLLLQLPLTIVESIIIGLALAFSATIGDLIESVIKRSAKVKDSGTLTPGRGGALDNLDSLITSAPLFYLLLQIFIK
jgi:phosphatidate cytidylyltransferase